MFLSSSSDISEFTDVVMSFIATLADTIDPPQDPPRVASSATYCTPCTHMTVWSGSAPTPSSSLRMTVVVGLISGNDEKAYLEEVANLSLWCQDNSLMLNFSKTKELIIINCFISPCCLYA